MASKSAAAAGLLLSSLVAAAKYDEYILAPSSRTLHPVNVYKVNGTVEGADSLTGGSGSAVFQGQSSVTYDFGINIAGLVTLQVGDVDTDQYIGLTYTESSLWISGEGCDATADAGIDEALWFHTTEPGSYTVSREHERGAFRYLSLLHNSTGNVQVDSVTVEYTPMPHWEDDQLRDYTGYFHCDDDLINRIWYAGAYTNQICTIDPEHGNALVHLGEINSTQPGSTGPNTWYNNFTISNGTSVLTDGAKRDRLVWAGDMAIAVPAITVTTYDLISVENSLNSLFNVQNQTTGQLPYAGIPFPPTYSATYHLYTLIGVADHYLYSGDMEYLQGKWDAWKLAMNFSLSFIDDSGMMNVTSPNDWLRFGMGAHNIEANSILYYTIYQGISLAETLGESHDLITTWTQTAERIKTSANARLWNDIAGMYHDNETTPLTPQDGNCWAIVANLTDSPSKTTRISSALHDRWTAYGAPAVEAANAISPFISGFELQAHLLAGNAPTALALMRRQWGFMLDDPRMTNSTFIEGYADDGVLHYAPYSNDPRISHAHGWATGPTSTLTFYLAGLHLLSAGGRTWEIAPAPGGLTSIDAGFSTTVGEFASTVSAGEDGTVLGLNFTTPAGTSGSVVLPGVSGSLMSQNGSSLALRNGRADNVPGGMWRLMSNSTAGGAGNGSAGVPEQVGNGAGVARTSVVALLAALFGLLM